MNDAPFLGIDFGTSNSSMAWFNPRTGQAEVLRNAEGEEKTPSLVYYGDDEILVGSAVERYLEDERDRARVAVSVKRELARPIRISLGGRRLSPVEIAAEVLAKLRRDADELHFHEPVERAVITHPATFDEAQRQRLREAADLAGFQSVELLAEPVAAAVAYAEAGLNVGRHMLVYDFGGGTFDVAVLTRHDAGRFRLAADVRGLGKGGDDLDRLLYDHFDGLAEEELGRPLDSGPAVNLFILRACRDIKHHLTHRRQHELRVRLGRNGEAVQFRAAVRRDTFEDLARPLLADTVRLTKAVLDEASAAGDAIDSVILIGGSSRIPLVRQMLAETLGIKPLRWEKADLAVALGAAAFGQRVYSARGEALMQPLDRPQAPKTWIDTEDPVVIDPIVDPSDEADDSAVTVFPVNPTAGTWADPPRRQTALAPLNATRLLTAAGRRHGAVCAISFFHSGDWLYTAHADGRLYAWNTETGEAPSPGWDFGPLLGAARHAAMSFAIAPSGSFAVRIECYHGAAPPRGLWEEFSPPQDFVSRYAVLNLEYRQLVANRKCRGRAAAAFLRDERLLLCSADEGESGIWKIEQGRRMRRESPISSGIRRQADPQADYTGYAPRAHLSADGRRVAVSDLHEICVCDLPGGEVVWRRPLLSQGEGGGRARFPLSLHLSRDGRHCLIGWWLDRAELWDIEADAPYSRFDCCRDLALLPGGPHLLGVGGPEKPGSLRLWKLAGGQPLDAHVVPSATLTSAAASPDGRSVAFGDNDGAVYLWKAG